MSTPDDVLEPAMLEFFRQYRLQRAPRASTCERIMRYVLQGNRSLGVTPDRRADVFRQQQIEWIGKRVVYIGDRTGTVRYIVPVNIGPLGSKPRFDGYVRWDEPIEGSSVRRTTPVPLATLKLLTP